MEQQKSIIVMAKPGYILATVAETDTCATAKLADAGLFSQGSPIIGMLKLYDPSLTVGNMTITPASFRGSRVSFCFNNS